MTNYGYEMALKLHRHKSIGLGGRPHNGIQEVALVQVGLNRVEGVSVSISISIFG